MKMIAITLLLVPAASLRLQEYVSPPLDAQLLDKKVEMEESAAMGSEAGESVSEKLKVMKGLGPNFYDDVSKSISDEILMEKVKTIKSLSLAGGMNPSEYFAYFKHIRDHAPQKLLVWGLGWDSVLASKLNEGGKTQFLEMNAEWAEKTDNKNLNYISYDTKVFNTKAGSYREFIKQPHGASIPGFDSEECWDTILVDSPNGHFGGTPGRQVPLYMAKQSMQSCISKKKYTPEKESKLTVFVHDCKRPLEHYVSRAFFGEPEKEFGHKTEKLGGVGHKSLCQFGRKNL